MRSNARVLVTLALALLVASLAEAQRPRLTFDASIGTSRGYGGGPLSEREGVSSDLTLAVIPADRTGGVLAVSVGTIGALGIDDCSVDVGFPCLPGFRNYQARSLLAGWQWKIIRGSGRALLGYARLRSIDVPAPIETGMQTRVDFSTAPLGRIAGVFSLRAAFIHPDSATPARLFAASLGLRLQ